MTHVAILVNVVNERYHPMPYRIAPRPSEDPTPGVPCRHKSIGHHTVGFATLAEAEADIATHEDWWPTGLLVEWDGVGIPASVNYFPAWTPVEVKKVTA